MRRPTLHRCPPNGTGLMPCCGKNPLEASRADRMTVHPHLVTCNQPDSIDPYANDSRVTRRQADLYDVTHDGQIVDIVQLANGTWVAATRRVTVPGDFQAWLERQPSHPTRDVAIHSVIGNPQT